MSTSSGLSSKSGTPGTKDAKTPTSVKTRGAEIESLRDEALTKMTTATSATTATGVLTCPLFQPLECLLTASCVRFRLWSFGTYSGT